MRAEGAAPEPDGREHPPMADCRSVHQPLAFRQAIGVVLQMVPYQDSAPALNALLGGQVDLLCDQSPQTMQHIKVGSLKLDGVTTRERIKALPDAPTLDEQG
jgi:tripartite-type tricarboxylate transporter receptor subunit TctC